MLTKQSIQDFRETNRVLMQSADFVYLLPHPALRRWISNYTITFPGKGLLSDQYTVMPHGSATLVFSCNENGISSNLYGPITKPACVGQRANSYTMLFIVEFQPAGYYAFSAIPQKKLTDLVFPFAEIDAPLNRLIAQLLETAHNLECVITAMDKLLLTQLKTELDSQEFALANQMIVTSGGQLFVKDIAQAVFYSERHLNRLFDQHIGVNIKSVSRLVRINKALRLLQCPSQDILQVSMQAGFYDVPHFIHDFKTICGITPLEYRDNQSNFYSEIAKF